MQFYVLHNVVGSPSETEYEQMEPIHRGAAAMCPECGEGYLTLLRWLPPYRAGVHVWGREPGDILFGSWDRLVSDRFRRAWQAEGLRGLDEFEPVEIIRVRPKKYSESLPFLFRITAQWGSTTLDFDRSGIEVEGTPTCRVCRKGGGMTAVRGLAIDESTWNGDDIFRPLGSVADIIVSERVRDMVKAHDLKNANLTPVEKFVWPRRNKHLN